jgi:hypothetical protein
MEGSHSGLVRPPAKRLPYESGVPGSNPGPSAIPPLFIPAKAEIHPQKLPSTKSEFRNPKQIQISKFNAGNRYCRTKNSLTRDSLPLRERLKESDNFYQPKAARLFSPCHSCAWLRPHPHLSFLRRQESTYFEADSKGNSRPCRSYPLLSFLRRQEST